MEAHCSFLDLVVTFGAFYAVSGLTVNVGSHWTGNGTLSGPLIVENQELVVYYEISADDPSDSDSETNRALGHTFVSLGLVPSLTICNSTWSQTFSFGQDAWKPELGYWEMHLPCNTFTCSRGVNVGEWYGIVEMDVNTGLLRKVVSIVDPDTEPIQIISEAMSILSPTLPGMNASFGRLISSQSPCSPDVLVIASISHNSDVIVGISYEGLKPDTVKWFDLTTILCLNTSSQECNPGRLIDFKLTSEHLIILTSEVIFTIYLTGQSLNKESVNLINTESVTEGILIDNTRLSYTPTCNAQHLLDEVVLLLKQLPYPDITPQILAVSHYPFTSWSPLNLTDGVPILGLHLPQSSRFLILTNHEGQHRVSLYPQDQLFGPQGSGMKPVYAPKVIPSSFIPHGACLDMTGYHSFFYGNQIYRSYDSVNFHLLATLPPGDYITTCATSIDHHTTVFLSHSNNIYIAKTGIPDRIVKATDSIIVHQPSILFIDHLGDVYAGGVSENGQQTWIQSIDVTALINEASHIVQAPITIQHITATRFILWQENNQDDHRDDHTDDDDTDDDDIDDDEDDMQDKNVLNKTVVGQEIVGSGFRLLITNMRALSGGTMVAMATSLEPSLHANMRTPDIAEGVHDLLLKESPCQHVMIPHPSVAKQPTVYMDVGDTFTFQVSASYVGQIRQYEKAMMSVQVTNPSLIHVKTSRTYNRYGMETAVITVRHRVHNKGISSILINIPSASLQCNSVCFTLTIHCTCPPTKRLHFVYDPPVTVQDFLYGSPKNRKNQSLLTTLDVNYRPPSRLGISVPLTSNIYNADPSQPRLNDHYEISKASGLYKQCAGKQSREECQCTDEMKLSSLELFTDCKEKVYRITYTEDLYPHLVISERGKEDQDLDIPYILTIKEVNDREDFVIEAAKIEYMSEIAKIVGIPVNHLHSPNQLVIKFLSTELYHFRLTVIDGFSYCTLEDEFQVYVDRAPLPGLSQMIIFATVSVLMGGVVFFIYLSYIRKSQIHRTRSMMALFGRTPRS